LFHGLAATESCPQVEPLVFGLSPAFWRRKAAFLQILKMARLFIRDRWRPWIFALRLGDEKREAPSEKEKGRHKQLLPQFGETE